MREHFFEVMSLLVVTGGLAISFISLRHKFKKDEQERHRGQITELMLHSEWKKNIEFEIQKVKLETEEIRTARSKNLEEIWEAIEQLKKEHDKDMKDIGCQFTEMMKEIRTKNDELIKLVSQVNETVLVLKTQFHDHKEDHNIKGK